MADLDQFLNEDSDLRATWQMRPHDVELPFGMGGSARRDDRDSADAAEVAVGGRTIRLRGLVDRVDWRRDGVPVVLDYKTGRAASQKSFETDPVLGGTKLQLGAYATAARQMFDTTAAAHAYYWYVSDKGKFSRAGYVFGDSQEERFRSAVSTIVAGVESGQFPPQPGEYSMHWGDYENCSFCPFTRLCPQDRADEFEAAVLSGRLAEYLDMQNGPQDSDGESAEVSS